MPEYSARNREGEEFRISGPEGASDADIIAKIEEWLGSPAGRVDRAFNDLRRNRDPMQGASRVARSVAAGDTDFGSPLTNAVGAAAITSPLWGPPAAAGAGMAGRAAVQYGAPVAAGAALSHLGLPDWVNEMARDYILGRLLGLGKK